MSSTFNEFNDIIYLCKCAVHNEIPSKEKISEMDISSLFEVSKNHSLIAMVAYSLESAGYGFKEFHQEKEKAIRKVIFLDAERKKLTDFFEDNHIWYMPLKGVFLKDYYPKIGMRQMADNDILFDENFRKDVKNYFIQNGYKVVDYGNTIHDTYEKAPILNFEMHISLFVSAHFENGENYYRNIKERLILSEQTQYSYHFSKEDFYIYFIAHDYKHFITAGTGIRSLLDCFLFLKKEQENLDWEYIEKECRQLGILEFEQQIRRVSDAVFGMNQKTLSESDTAFLECFMGKSTYGAYQNAIAFKMNRQSKKSGKTSKISYILYRIIPDQEWFEMVVPFVWKHKILIPFYLLFRFFRGITVKRKIFFKELKAILQSKKQDKKL